MYDHPMDGSISCVEDVSEVESGGARTLAKQGATCKKGAGKVKKVAKQSPGKGARK